MQAGLEQVFSLIVSSCPQQSYDDDFQEDTAARIISKFFELQNSHEQLCIEKQHEIDLLRLQ